MIIRFVAQNIYSFHQAKEFNMLPRPKIRTPEGHKYSLKGVDLLKLSAIYGANGAGKSNLIKAIYLLQKLVKKEISAAKVQDAQFKFERKDILPQTLAVEFIQDQKPYYYAVEMRNGSILTEELYRSGLGKGKDSLLFERKMQENGSTQLIFSDAFEQDAKGKLLKSILLEEFLTPNFTVFQWLAKRDHPLLNEIKTAYQWFEYTLQILTPDSRPLFLAQSIDQVPKFKQYAEDTMNAYNLGVSKLMVVKKRIEDIFGEENESDLIKLKDHFSKNENSALTLKFAGNDQLEVVKEDGQLYGKQLKVYQSDSSGQEISFDLNELSDGTIRLLDFLPLFRDIMVKPKVFFVDEIERSMHPSMAKELVKKFSLDPDTKGQLVFTTHESNLLDQDLFRQDEIWFAEKGPSGATDLYALSDFKEHNTIDIRKGYLNGRYGAVPFLANLHDLNWHQYDSN